MDLEPFGLLGQSAQLIGADVRLIGKMVWLISGWQKLIGSLFWGGYSLFEQKRKKGSLSASISRLSARPFFLSTAYQLLSARLIGPKGPWPEICIFSSMRFCSPGGPAGRPIGQLARYPGGQLDIQPAGLLSNPPAG